MAAIDKHAQSALDDDNWNLWTDCKGKDIHEKFQTLRKKEHLLLECDHNHRLSASIADGNKFFSRVYTETSRYIRFVVETWSGLAFMIMFGGVGVFDIFTMFLYASGGTVVLGLLLVFCLVTSHPWWSHDFNPQSLPKDSHHVVHDTNRETPNLYQGFTPDQFNAAIAGLQSERITQEWPKMNPKTERYFDLDVAKLLYVPDDLLYIYLSLVARFCTMVYQFKNESLRESMAKLDHPEDHETETWLDWILRVLDLSDLLWHPIKWLDNVEHARCHEPNSPASSTDSSHSDDKVGGEDPSKDGGAVNIRLLCKVLDQTATGEEDRLQYETVSQLGDTSSAVAGLFWKPKQNWMVVVFKGTSPFEYGEWISNLNSKLAPIGSHVHGFKRVHKGFKERVFPEDSSKNKLEYGSRPYDTISLGIKTLAKHLRSEQPANQKTLINVWFTGHSLGCSTASLVYAQMLNGDHRGIRLRDAYLFAAPIVCDRESVDIFNAKMFNKKTSMRTMWRITSGNDFVATCLPELGDFRDLVVSPNNAFAFAHLGTEVKLQNGPRKCQVSGKYFPYYSTLSTATRAFIK